MLALSLFEVITLKEASDIWGLTPRAVHLRLLRWENKNPDTALLRRSGGTWLTTMQAMRAVYGPPVNKRKDYENE